MPDNIQNSIINYFKKEAQKGHFEVSKNEIWKGVNGDYTNAALSDSVSKLEGSDILRQRKKNRFTFYYLSEIQNMCRAKWGKG